MSEDIDGAPERGHTGRSQSVIVDLVGPDQRVLELGCAVGHVARALVEQGCSVVGVERDAAAAEKARDDLELLLVGDLDTLDLIEAFGERSFDAVVYDDVLGDLRDPRDSLRQARRLLRPGGSLVISIHNVGHGDVRLALLAGRWDYAQSGPLDESHLRFFTHDSIRRLLQTSGFAVVDTHRLDRPMFGTELAVSAGEHPAELVQAVLASPDSQTYQFVLRAVPDDAEGAVALLSEREHAASVEATTLRLRVGELELQLASTQDRLALAEAERDIRTASAEHAMRQLTALRNTRTFRWSRRARTFYSRLRERRP